MYCWRRQVMWALQWCTCCRRGGRLHASGSGVLTLWKLSIEMVSAIHYRHVMLFQYFWQRYTNMCHNWNFINNQNTQLLRPNRPLTSIRPDPIWKHLNPIEPEFFFFFSWICFQLYSLKVTSLLNMTDFFHRDAYTISCEILNLQICKNWASIKYKRQTKRAWSELNREHCLWVAPEWAPELDLELEVYTSTEQPHKTSLMTGLQSGLWLWRRWRHGGFGQ